MIYQKRKETMARNHNGAFRPERHALLDKASTHFLAEGKRILQGYRMGGSDAEHVQVLLTLMSPPQGAVVADLGCGFGEVARLMREPRPDLRFVLLNQNKVQLDNCPKGPAYHHVLADLHDTGLPDACVDGVMLTYTLCHADVPIALEEAARITRPGGFLFVFDYERLGGDNAKAEEVCAARWFPRDCFVADATRAGWECPHAINPQGSDEYFRKEWGEEHQDLYREVFGRLRPIVWRMRRGQLPVAVSA